MESVKKLKPLAAFSKVDTAPVYTIGMMAKKVGVAVQTLRMYEQAGLILPVKTPAGRRMYSTADLRLVQCIRRLIKEKRLNLEGIRRLLSLVPCWEIKPCTPEERKQCAAYRENNTPCWALKETACRQQNINCRLCPVYNWASYCDRVKSLLKQYGYS